MNVVDSSGWLEYFADGKNAGFFSSAIEDLPRLLVPTIELYEVFKRVLQQRGETEALLAVATMKQATVVDLDAELGLAAAALARDLNLPLADSIIYATVQKFGATLWTQDSDFDGLAHVRYVATSRH
ncbi:MAG: type II toxin-antitoxin system VapC family toxin [Proteobacteria bacterium]|nr:type II toxin-antitoxin system VapC family toxin [Pseudomonadota bacterium]